MSKKQSHRDWQEDTPVEPEPEPIVETPLAPVEEPAAEPVDHVEPESAAVEPVPPRPFRPWDAPGRTVRVTRLFQGRLTHERPIAEGDYSEHDPRLFGLASYLLDNGFAEVVE